MKNLQKGKNKMYKNILNFKENSIEFDMTENAYALEDIQTILNEVSKGKNINNPKEANEIYIDLFTKFLGEENYNKLIGDNKKTLLNNIIIMKEVLTLIQSQKEIIDQSIEFINTISFNTTDIKKEKPKKTNKKYIDKIK